MNKTMQKLMMALAVCGALCGSAMAAPKGNPPPKGKAPSAMMANAPKGRTAKTPAPARQTAKHHATPARPHAQRHEIVRRAPPPPPPARHHEPKHHRHNNHTLHTEDWCEIGVSLLGGLVGGLIGASI